MRVSAHCYYADIIKAKGNMPLINQIPNDAIKDNIVPTKSKEDYNYDYLCTVAKSLGFKFAHDWELL